MGSNIWPQITQIKDKKSWLYWVVADSWVALLRIDRNELRTVQEFSTSESVWS